MLDRFLRWHAANSRELLAAEADFDVVLGRARHPRPGRPARARRRGPAGRRRPQDRQERAAGDRDPRPAGRLPGRDRRRRLRRARQRARRRGAAAGRHRREGQGAAPGAAAGRRPGRADLGRRAAGRGGGGDGRGHLRGAHRQPLLALPGPAHLPPARARPAGDGMSPRAGSAAEEQLSFDDLFGGAAEPAPAPRRVLDPAEVAARCGLSYAPSAEQARVVSAPADRPLVVVAGAGSGKTETMAARVSWLDRQPGRGARGHPRAHVHPQGRQRAQRAHPAAAGRPGPAPRDRAGAARAAGDRDADGVDLPRVRRGAGRRARAADRGRARRRRARPGHVLGAGRHRRHRLHRRHGRRPARPGLHRRGRAGAGRRARRARRDPGRPARVDDDAASTRSPAIPTPRARRGPTPRCWTMLTRQRARVALLPLVEAFEARKRAAGAIDYADQVSHAARIAVAAPEVGRRERARWQVVLLDEYQDTSVGQLRMLEALFGRATGHPVLAVGDPRQSIYGWRGASAGTIERFARTFPGARGKPAAAAHPGHELAQRRVGARDRQRRLRPPAAPAAGAARPRAGARRPAAGRSPSGCTRPSPRRTRPWPSGWPPAGTAPTRSSRPARTAAGRPSPSSSAPASSWPPSPRRCASATCRWRSSGLGGLLEVPEVSDVVATLTVLVDPTAGDALGRLLTGARWRIGPRDLAALEARARALVHARRPAASRGRRAPAPEPPTERGSIIEALDDLGDAADYSAAAWRRLRRLSRGAAPAARPAGRLPCPTWSTRSPRTLGPGDGAGQRARGQPGRRPGAPGRAARRRRRVHRAGRAALAAGVPRLPARRRGARARPGARARSRSTRRRCSCSPGTRRRGWSGTSSPSPG